MQRQLTVPYSPQQNGVVERRNQTIVRTTRSLLMTVGMPKRFWGEAVMTAVYLLNRSPTRSLDGKTPHEAWYNKKLAVHHLRVFGYIAYMKVTRPHLAKLDPRGLKVIFIGYEPGSKAYRLYDPAGGRAHVSRDVIFNESTFWQWNGVTEADQNPNQFTIEYLVIEPGEGGAQHREPSSLPTAATPEPMKFATPQLRIRHWMPITMMIWWPGTGGWKT